MNGNDPHSDINEIRADLSKKALCTLPKLDKVLAKAPENRYQTGAAFAQYLGNCLKIIKKNSNEPGK